MSKRRSDKGFELYGKSTGGDPYTLIVHSAPFGCISYRAVSKTSGEVLVTGITDMPRTERERHAFLSQVQDEVDFAWLPGAFDGDEIPF